MEANIISLSGPSAVGKSFFIDSITQTYPQISEILGLTTRPMRPGEINGKSGIFMPLSKFDELEKMNKLLLVKEFFGNKYAWYKDDLVNDEKLRIMNISYKSIAELKDMGLNLYSIFIRPESEEKLVEMLRLRNVSKEEYLKRLAGYYESEKFLAEYEDIFDLIFINSFDNKSLNELLNIIDSKFIDNNKIQGHQLVKKI